MAQTCATIICPITGPRNLTFDIFENHCTHFTHRNVLNLSRPSDAYMRLYTTQSLVQIMACRLSGVKPLSKQRRFTVNWVLRNKVQWKFNRNTTYFTQRMWRPCLQNVTHFVSASVSMGKCKKDVTPLLTHWSYVFLALTHRCFRVTPGTYLQIVGVGLWRIMYHWYLYSSINETL